MIKEERQIKIVQNFGPSAQGGSASSRQFVFNLLDTKNERVVVYVCLTIVAICWIVWG